MDDGFFVKIKWSYSVNGSKRVVLSNNSFGNNGGDGGESEFSCCNIVMDCVLCNIGCINDERMVVVFFGTLPCLREREDSSIISSSIIFICDEVVAE